METQEPLEEALVNPTRMHHKPVIYAFLQRLQKDHIYAAYFRAPTQLPQGGLSGMAPPASFAGLSAAQ